ncbi:MAG TPA: DUF4340 domain-containing protein [Candidatus Blautia faecipullorum]|nr:DUF4340 domain-containing protein [Candidatus Blautia faecipullorum]
MKKKTVKLISSIAALGVLSGAYVGVRSYVSSQEEKEAAEADESVQAVDINSDDVSAVAFLSDDGEEVILEKEDDSWTKKDEPDFPLDQDTVSGAVSGISDLTADQELSEAEDLSEYDLDEPDNEITLTTEEGEETVIQIGMKNDSTSQYYIRKSDDEKIYLVAASSIDPFMNSVYDFAEADTFPAVTSSTITEVKVEKENGYELSQDSATLGWNVSDGQETEKADTTKAGTVTSAIGALMYGDFVDYNCTDGAKYGFDDPYAVITAKYTEEEEIEADTDDTEVSEEEDAAEETSEEAEAEAEEVSGEAETEAEEVSGEGETETEEVSGEAEAEAEEVSGEAEAEAEEVSGEGSGEEEMGSEEASEDEDNSETEDAASDEAESTEASGDEDAASEEEEPETVTVDKELVIYVGDETEGSRYVKVNDSAQVYTITEDSLADILDNTVEDFYNLTVSYLSENDLDHVEIKAQDGAHQIQVIRETEEDEDGEETTTYSYELDGKEMEETDFTSFYNKLINMAGQERLTEAYEPEEDPVYTFTLTDMDGGKMVVEYYEYDANFYAAETDGKVYLVNKMNVRDLEASYQEMIEAGEESETDSGTDESDINESENAVSDTGESEKAGADAKKSEDTGSDTKQSENSSEEEADGNSSSGNEEQ